MGCENVVIAVSALPTPLSCTIRKGFTAEHQPAREPDPFLLRVSGMNVSLGRARRSTWSITPLSVLLGSQRTWVGAM